MKPIDSLALRFEQLIRVAGPEMSRAQQDSARMMFFAGALEGLGLMLAHGIDPRPELERYFGEHIRRKNKANAPG